MHTIITQLPDGPAEICQRPGIKAPDTANVLVYAATKNVQGKRIFVIGPGSIPSALWAARQGGSITTWSENINYTACIMDTFESASVDPPTVFLQDGFDHITTDAFDTAILHLPRGKALQVESLQLAAAVLKSGGRLIFTGAKNEGVKSALKFAKDIFHQAGITAQKGGYHIGLAEKPSEYFPLPQLVYEQCELSLNGVPTILASCSGVFATGRLDDGAKTLIESMVIKANTHILDMGCGTGLIGLTAARKGAKVTLTDVSVRAVESAKRTLKANNTPAEFIHCSGAELCKPGTFDAVYSNPPFHKGRDVDYETTRYLLDQAERALRKGGELYLVANSFLKYENWIKEKFTNVAVFYENNKFRVWTGTKKP